MKTFNFWDTEVTYLKKVGPERADTLKSELGIRTYSDLLHFFPRKYIDKSNVVRVRDIRMDMPYVTLKGKISDFEFVKGNRGGRLTAEFSDGTGRIDLVWFKGIRWIRESVQPGQEIVIFGQPKFFGRKVQIVHPEIDKKAAEGEAVNTLTIVPYYPSGEKLKKKGLDSKGIRALMHHLLEIGQQDMRENLPTSFLTNFGLITRKQALNNIHFPESFQMLQEAQKRLKFEELFFFQLMLAKRKEIDQPRRQSNPFPHVGEYLNTFYHEHLPFELTGAQKRVIKEVRTDLARPIQMNRLVQGDVGSGKTMVAFMTMLIALDNGFQCALMAPTEILAEQHYNNFRKYGDKMGIRVGFLSGSVKGSDRKQLLFELQEGIIQILVGTHALIEDPVVFANLGLVVIDEQHKFGVVQRMRLWQKSTKFPHNMLMTATPIPRTLGLTLYGDVDISVIDELPPGRTPIKTAVRTEAQRKEVFGFIRRELDKGRQAYIVYPLVEESEKLDYLAVTEGYEAVKRYFQDIHVGIVHGRMKSDVKEQEMQRFKRGETKIMVATTVIEVGVDVPNSTIMVIENSEKFGLSQLHQLRGRVGRGGNQSYCILMVGTNKPSEDAKTRLRAMAETTDGFKIADIDLKLRGPGDFMGTRQSGMPEFKLANIIEDSALLRQAREAAFRMMQADPGLEKLEHASTKAFLTQYIKEQNLLIGVA